MVLDFALDLIRQISQINTVLLFGFFFIFLIVAYKIFQALIKAFIVGVIAASFPVVANLMGMNIPLTFQSIVWFAIFGVASYILYATISSGTKIARFAMRPFKGAFSRKPVEKVVIREKEKS